MVRKNPLYERGPIPPKGRPSRPKEEKSPKTLFELCPEIEHQKLWNHVIYSTAKSIDTLEAYTNIGMSGYPLDDLLEFRDRLNKLIEKHSNGEHNG